MPKGVKDVQHFNELQVMEGLEFPDEPITRTSPLRDAVAKVMTDPELHGKYVLLASYGNSEGASSAKQGLHDRHGNRPEHQGFEFRTMQLADGRTGLLVNYQPGRVVEGEFDRHIAEREARRRQRQAEKEAAERAQANTPEGTEGAITVPEDAKDREVAKQPAARPSEGGKVANEVKTSKAS